MIITIENTNHLNKFQPPYFSRQRFKTFALNNSKNPGLILKILMIL